MDGVGRRGGGEGFAGVVKKRNRERAHRVGGEKIIDGRMESTLGEDGRKNEKQGIKENFRRRSRIDPAARQDKRKEDRQEKDGRQRKPEEENVHGRPGSNVGNQGDGDEKKYGVDPSKKPAKYVVFGYGCPADAGGRKEKSGRRA